MAKPTKNTVDQSTIPRPLNCFLMYRLEKQKEIVAKCSGANHRDISKIIARWWQEASDEEKQPFREKARIAKLEHRKLYPDYRYTPKKKVTPKRVYIRKNKKELFTSRATENNKIMELIYEDPNALESINDTESLKSVNSMQKNKTAKKSKVSKKRVANTVKMENVYEEFEEFDMPQYAASVCSMQSVPDFNFDSPQATSPFTDCYSEYDMPSPYFEGTPIDMQYPSFMSPIESLSPFTVLDTPYVSVANAYMPFSINEQMDYFQLEPSYKINTVNINIGYKPQAQEFNWPSTPDFYFGTQNSNAPMMQASEPFQYINPSLLHM